MAYLRESERGEGGLARITEPIGGLSKVTKERVHVRGVFRQRIFLLITKKRLELFECHVLHVLAVRVKLFTNLRREGGREGERE